MCLCVAETEAICSVSAVCLSVCVSLSCQRYETTRTSTVDHGECPAIKPPTFCLLLRALDRGRPPRRWIGRSQAIGGSEGRFGTTAEALIEFEVVLSTVEPDVVVACFDGRDWCAEEQDTELRGVRVRSDRIAQ